MGKDWMSRGRRDRIGGAEFFHCRNIDFLLVKLLGI